MYLKQGLFVKIIIFGKFIKPILEFLEAKIHCKGE